MGPRTKFFPLALAAALSLPAACRAPGATRVAVDPAAPLPDVAAAERGADELTVEPLDLEGVRGARVSFTLEGTPEEVVAMLLDFERMDGRRPWAVDYEPVATVDREDADETISAPEPDRAEPGADPDGAEIASERAGTGDPSRADADETPTEGAEIREAESGASADRARWKFEGKAGLNPTIVLEFTLDDSRVPTRLEFRTVEPAFGLAAFFGLHELWPHPDRQRATVMRLSIHIDSGVPFANATADDLELGLREDVRMLRAWMAERVDG